MILEALSNINKSNNSMINPVLFLTVFFVLQLNVDVWILVTLSQTKEIRLLRIILKYLNIPQIHWIMLEKITWSNLSHSGTLHEIFQQHTWVSSAFKNKISLFLCLRKLKSQKKPLLLLGLRTWHIFSSSHMACTPSQWHFSGILPFM